MIQRRGALRVEKHQMSAQILLSQLRAYSSAEIAGSWRAARRHSRLVAPEIAAGHLPQAAPSRLLCTAPRAEELHPHPEGPARARGADPQDGRPLPQVRDRAGEGPARAPLGRRQLKVDTRSLPASSHACRFWTHSDPVPPTCQPSAAVMPSTCRSHLRGPSARATDLLRLRPNLADFGPNLVNMRRSMAATWPTHGPQLRGPKPAETGQTWPDFVPSLARAEPGYSRAKSGQLSADVGPTSAEVGPGFDERRVRFGPGFDRMCASSTEVCAIWTECSPMSGRFDPYSSNFGRSRPDLSQIFAAFGQVGAFSAEWARCRPNLAPISANLERSWPSLDRLRLLSNIA